MSSTVITTVGGVVVITQGQSANDAATVTIQQLRRVEIQKFSRARPQVLGVIQIIVGLVILLFGITVASMADSFGVFSGIFVWGPALYITTGSLTIVAGNRLTLCLVKGALGVSVVAALAATTAFILHSCDAASMVYCYVGYNYSYCESRMLGVSAVLAIFSLLELLVAITAASYACSATCVCNDSPGLVTVPGQVVIQDFQKRLLEPPLYSTVINN